MEIIFGIFGVLTPTNDFIRGLQFPRKN